MTPQEFEQALEAHRVTVYFQSGQLRYLAPPGVMTAELRAAAATQYRDVLVRLGQAADAALDKALADEHQRAIAKTTRGALEAAA